MLRPKTITTDYAIKMHGQRSSEKCVHTTIVFIIFPTHPHSHHLVNKWWLPLLGHVRHNISSSSIPGTESVLDLQYWIRDEDAQLILHRENYEIPMLRNEKRRYSRHVINIKIHIILSSVHQTQGEGRKARRSRFLFLSLFLCLVSSEQNKPEQNHLISITHIFNLSIITRHWLSPFPLLTLGLRPPPPPTGTLSFHANILNCW